LARENLGKLKDDKGTIPHFPDIIHGAANTISALHCTQVSVEWLLSALKSILWERWSNMKNDLLKSILFLHQNGF